MSDDPRRILRELQKGGNKISIQAKQQAVRKVGQEALQNLRDDKKEVSGLTSVPTRVMAIKEMPDQAESRGRFVGERALPLIAKRALVGLAWLRDSAETVVYDEAPIPSGEFAITPLSLIRNADGTADLLVTVLGQKFLAHADYTIHNTPTEIPMDPPLSPDNIARYLFFQNQGNNPVYVCIDGEYDKITKTIKKGTTPASGVGLMLAGSGVYTDQFMMKANPRLISPSGDQTVNIVIQR